METLKYFFDSIETIKMMIVIIEVTKIVVTIAIIYSIFNISSRATNIERGQDQMLERIKTLEYQNANINNNLHAILEELQELNDKIPYQAYEEEPEYIPNSGINDFNVYDNNR